MIEDYPLSTMAGKCPLETRMKGVAITIEEQMPSPPLLTESFSLSLPL